ncbi:MAG: GPW/gp25 family protein [Methylococcaceae bacterium]|nr:GPW/gp25 family protein [Methylococcaceae bacterium]
MEYRKNSFLGRGWSFPPTFEAASGELMMVEAEEDIRQSLAILISTVPGERIMLPQYGCALHSLIFESIDNTLLTEIKTVLADAILYFEPRIRVETIKITTDRMADGLLVIAIEYTVVQTNTRSNMVFPFYLAEGTNAQRYE